MKLTRFYGKDERQIGYLDIFIWFVNSLKFVWILQLVK